MEAYRAEFAAAVGKKVAGEASNSYLYSPLAAERIKRYIPDVKLIAILRNPADRAYSRYLQMVRAGRETITDFSVALTEENRRIAEGWWPDFHYLRMGLYHEQLQRYFFVYPASQIKVYLFEDFQGDALALVQNAFRFLDVDPTFVPDTGIRYSSSGLPRNQYLHLVLRRARTLRPLAERWLSRGMLQIILAGASKIHNRNLIKPPLSPDDQNWLIDRYRDDTLRLQTLLQRDLSSWLT